MLLPDLLPFWALALLFNFALQIAGFTAAFLLRTEKFFDFFGAGNFIIVAVASWLLSEELADPRRIISTGLFCASRLWLLVFLAIRAHDRGDARFNEVKTEFAAFLAFWIGQAVWVSLISLPVIAINTAREDPIPIGVAGVFFIALFAFSLITQIHSDMIKRMWVQEGRPGHFCRRGCWSFSRHPNYAGEIGMTVAAVGLVGPLILFNDDWSWLALSSVLSPIFTFVILMFASGMPTAEGKALNRYYEKAGEDYAAYRAATPILVPWCFPGYNYVPTQLKQVCCCEWSMYELPQEFRNETASVVGSGASNSYGTKVDAPHQEGMGTSP